VPWNNNFWPLEDLGLGPLPSNFWTREEAEKGKHSAWPPEYKVKRARVNLELDQHSCPGYVYVEPGGVSERYKSCSTTELLDRHNIALDVRPNGEGIVCIRICTRCYVQSARVCHNVWMINTYNAW